MKLTCLIDTSVIMKLFPINLLLIGPLHDPVTGYKITHAVEQVAQWDFQNKGRSSWTGTSCFGLQVPLQFAHQHV